MAVRSDEILIFAIVLPLVAIIGFATQRGNVCSVLAARQIAETGATSRLRSFLLASLWSLVVVTLLAWTTSIIHLPRTFPFDWLALTGAAAYGVGTMINGACVFGTAARVLSGNLSYLATLVGIVLAGAIGAHYNLRTLRMPSGSSVLSTPNDWGTLIVVVAASICLIAFARFWMKQARAGRRLPGVIAASRWSTSLAMPVIGVVGGLLLASGLSWNYPVLLRSVGSALVGADAALAPITWLGPVAFVIGGVAAAMSGGRARLRRPQSLQVVRSLFGGGIMGIAGFLIPGGNDVLLLAGVPSLSVHALVAYGTMLIVQIGIAVLVTKRKRGQR